MIRGIAWALTLEVAIALAIVASCAGAAHATPPAQTETNRIARWMASQLRVDIPTPQLNATPHHQLDDDCNTQNVSWIAYTCSENPMVLRIRPWLVGALERRSCFALRVMLHELAHSTRGYDDTSLEEGVADAISIDLYPAAAHQLHCRNRGSYIPMAYYPQAADVWATSVKATGSPNRSTRAARLWIRRLWAADTNTRHMMIRDAQHNPPPRVEGTRNP